MNRTTTDKRIVYARYTESRFNTMYWSIGHRFDARNYFRSRRNRNCRVATLTGSGLVLSYYLAGAIFRCAGSVVLLGRLSGSLIIILKLILYYLRYLHT